MGGTMRKFLIASLIAANLATPGTAAGLLTDRSTSGQEAGAFAGARVRLSLGSNRRSPVLAGIVVAPTLRTERADRSSTLRFGEGIELGVNAGAPSLSLAGRPLSRDEAHRTSRQRAGISTLGWVAIGTGVVLVAGALLFLDAMGDASE